ncbi:MAG: tail fiber domain-containing protein [Candidatus Cloacimonetes bacterium]|nr:tail fiber domain-containing protein [Candidatus Cloacimonadota bacterium]
MKKLKKLSYLMLSMLVIFFATNLSAQNINNKIGGTGENDEFQVSDSEGNVKFVVQGDGNIGIGTTTPQALLDMTSTTKGILVPRMTQIQRNAISTPATGLLIYQTDNTPGFYFYNGSGWVVVGSGSMSINGLTDGKTEGGSVFLGSGAGANDDGTDNWNVGIGIDALNTNTTGGVNTATGYQALYSNTTGDMNTANGVGALYYNITGHGNTANGLAALYSNTTGSDNTANGVMALYYNTTGNNNTANGYWALYSNTTGYNNTANGYYSNYYNQTGSYNTIIGYESGKGTALHNKSGNVFLGYRAGHSATGSSNVFLGYKAGYNEAGDNKLYIENSNSSSPLIYGDFNTNLLRVNGTLDINSVYQFPTSDGALGQVLQTNGSGILSWTSGGGGASEINDLTDGKTGNLSVFLGSGAGANNSGISNVAVGIEVLNTNTSGYYNTATGYRTLFSNTTGYGNTANGYNALYSNTTGNNNTVNGFYANHFNQTGSYNTIIGYAAGKGTALHDKSGNVFLGYQAGYNEIGDNKLYIENSNSSSPLIYGDFGTNLLRVNGTLDINNVYQFPTSDGSLGQILQTNGGGILSWTNAGNEINGLLDGKTGGNSVFLGSGAGVNDDGTDNNNVAVGINAFNSNTSGFDNTATGYQSLFYNLSGYGNTANGTYALNSNTTGYNNTANGVSALFYNTSGHTNTANGFYALRFNTTGGSNTANGYGALYRNTTGNGNTANGYYANHFNQTGSNNTIIGFKAGYGTGVHNKSGNVFLGYKAGYYETGDNKLYIGNSNSSSPLIYGEFANNLLRINGTLDIYNAYQFPTTDGALGQFLQTNGTGTLSWSSASGVVDINGLLDGKTGGNSVFLGSGAGNDNSGGSYNAAVGYNALYHNTSGHYNTANGYSALNSNTTGSGNTAIGFDALSLNEGSNNTAIGYMANFQNRFGSNNTIIGYEAGKGTGIHDKSGNVFLGYQAGYSEHGSNILYIENSSSASPLIWGDFANDRIVINGNSTHNSQNRTFFSNGSAGGTTVWSNDSDERLKKNIETIPDALDKVEKLRGVNFEWKETENHEEGVKMGFIAQEVEDIIPEVVSKNGEYYSMQYAPITALLVEAVKEQQKMIEELQKEIEELKSLSQNK